jgi:hypothetical protein
VTFILKKMILGNLNLTGSEHMICEFQNQHELDYADRRKAMDEFFPTRLHGNLVIIGNLVIMRFSVYLCQRKSCNKHLRFSIHVSHVSW